MANEAKIETENTLDIQEETPKERTVEERLGFLENHMQQSIVVTNNLITYCNTIDKWRKMDFVPGNKDEQSEETTPVEETNEG